MKWWALAVWAIGVGVMTWSMARHNDPAAAYCATRTLPRNHRIVPADLKPFPTYGSPLLGEYVRDREIAKGDRIQPYELTTFPEMRVAEGKTPSYVPLPTQWNMQDALNAGSVVDVWDGLEQVAARARVLAVLSERTGTAANYIAVLETDPGEAKRLAKRPADLRILIRDLESGGKDGS